LIQDIDGLDEEAMYAFREMQSAGFVSSSTIKKDSVGNLQSVIHLVKSRFASLVATTNAEIYFDNLSRSIVLGIDESEEQTLKIIDAQNKKTAGLFDIAKALKGKELLQNCMRVLKSYEVVNKYANQIKLPMKAKMQRRLNSHYQDMIKQITLLNQFQRIQDEQGRLITELNDLVLATEIMFDSIMWKVDELDSSLRQFFDMLKAYLFKLGNHQTSFNTREVRQAFNLSPSQMHRYMQELIKLQYIHVSGGSSNRGYRYTVSYWDDMEKIRQEVKADLMKQIEAIK
jgi:predicted transcriptional regulator